MAKLCVVLLFVLLYSIQKGQCSNTTEATKLDTTLTTEKATPSSETIQSVTLDSTLNPILLEDKSESRDFGISLFIGGTLVAILIVPILLLVLLVLFAPVPGLFFPQGTLPGVNNGVLVAGRQLTTKLMDKLTPENMEAFRGMMESDICVQRISCEIMKASKELKMDRWLYGIMNDIPVGQSLKRKITRGAQFTRNCRRFSCDPLSSMWSVFT
ncbi:unnamed protein product [Allacma fusca]|uniref:Uncharacterized protein n=1 Tax=Allacma fusca TaxID=39272 RepID=A0A8J2PT55_9HEXA|nr:unnamed protein product [Allacma fusca]